MAALTQSTVSTANGPVAVAVNTLTASDTLTYSSGTKQKLVLYNSTAGSLTATITGSTSTTISPTGYGGTVSVAAGLPIVVPAGTCKAVYLDTISAWLSGNVTLTGGPALTAFLMN